MAFGLLCSRTMELRHPAIPSIRLRVVGKPTYRERWRSRAQPLECHPPELIDTAGYPTKV